MNYRFGTRGLKDSWAICSFPLLKKVQKFEKAVEEQEGFFLSKANIPVTTHPVG